MDYKRTTKTSPKSSRTYVCEKCSYSSNKLSNYKKHLQSKKHLGLHKDYTKTSSKSSPIYTCDICCYSTDKYSNFKRHIDSLRHKTEKTSRKSSQEKLDALTLEIEEQYGSISLQTSSKVAKTSRKSSPKNVPTEFTCDCGRVYSSRQNLYRHRKKCHHTETTIIERKDDENKTMSSMFLDLMEQYKDVIEDNKQIKEQLMEQNRNLVEIAKQPKTMVINNNTQNNYNLLNYLNTEYKDAMTIEDFLDSVQVTFEDLKNVRENGFLEGIGAKIVKELTDLPESRRPVHFSKRRLKEYFTKQIEGWIKDDKSKEHMHNMIRDVSQKHLTYLIDWKKQNAAFLESEQEYTKYQKTLFNTYKGISNDDESHAIRNKVFKQLESLTIKEDDVEN